MRPTIVAGTCLLAAGICTQSLAQTETSDAVANADTFFERLDDEVDSSTLGLYGLHLAAPGARGLDRLDDLLISSSLLRTATVVCVGLRSLDGRFEATNAYRVAVTGTALLTRWKLSPLTMRYADDLRAIGRDDLFAVASLPAEGSSDCDGASGKRLPVVDRERTPASHLHAALNAEGRKTVATLDVALARGTESIEGRCIELDSVDTDDDTLIDRSCEFALEPGAYGRDASLRVRFGKDPFFEEPAAVSIRLPARP